MTPQQMRATFPAGEVYETLPEPPATKPGLFILLDWCPCDPVDCFHFQAIGLDQAGVDFLAPYESAGEPGFELRWQAKWFCLPNGVWQHVRAYRSPAEGAGPATFPGDHRALFGGPPA